MRLLKSRVLAVAEANDSWCTSTFRAALNKSAAIFELQAKLPERNLTPQ
jgi:hypothetical protein